MSGTNPNDYSKGAIHLLVIVVESYQSEMIPLRHGRIKKLNEMVSLMQRRYQVMPVNTIKLFNEDASEDRIDHKLIELQERSTDDDSLIILFSGHSFIRHKIGESYWVPFDGQEDRISGCISSAALMVYIQAMRYRHILLLTDACLQDTCTEYFKKLDLVEGIFTRHFIAGGISSLSSNTSNGDDFWNTAIKFFDENPDDEASILSLSSQLENLKSAGKFGELFTYNYLDLDWLIRRTSDEDIFWEEVLEESTEAAFKRYVSNFPDGRYSSEAHQVLSEFAIDRNWEKVLEKNTMDEYEDFITIHPGCKYADEARARIADLKEQMKNYVRGAREMKERLQIKMRSVDDIVPESHQINPKKAIVVKRLKKDSAVDPPAESARAKIKLGDKRTTNRGSIRTSRLKVSDAGKPVPNSDGKSGNNEIPERFEAYPLISDPGLLARRSRFEVKVGFQEQLASEMREQAAKIVVESPKADENIVIVLMAEGATIDKEGQFQSIPLIINSQVVFTGIVSPEAEAVELHASYLYRGQLIGQATRHVPVKGGEPEQLNQVLFHSESIDVLEQKSPIDIHVWVEYSSVNRKLTWVIQHEEVTEEVSLAEVNLEDSSNLAKMLCDALEVNEYYGDAAWRALKNIGELISRLIPDAFFECIKNVARGKSDAPSVLIITNEYYIPWELAFSYELELDKEYPSILSLQVELGRWLMSKAPQQELECNKLYYDIFEVVAANYREAHLQLTSALNEKDFLIERFGAREVEAKKVELMSLVKQLPKRGRVLHMALHGHSGSKITDNKFQLEDGDLMAIEWIPPRRPKDLPAISFLFLNACRVGSASSILSSAAGFPGLILPKGVKGLIAPIWDVHDKEAQKWAELFYEKVIENRSSVGSAMLQARREMQKVRGSLTCMAYLYYGHPGLLFEAVYESENS
jgi:hypothetical protein